MRSSSIRHPGATLVDVPIDGSSPEAGLEEAVMLVRRLGGAVKRVSLRDGGCTLTVAVPSRPRIQR